MAMPFQPWRAALQPASFGGAGFYVETGGKSGGRRIAEHEYPKQDTPFGEDMGRKAHRWPITGYCIGPFYLDLRDALIAVCDSEGPYTLVHPSLGEEQVHCDTYTVTESREKGGYCTFDFVFLEAGQDPDASATSDTQAQVGTAATQASSATSDSLDSGLSGQGGIGSDAVAGGQVAPTLQSVGPDGMGAGAAATSGAVGYSETGIGRIGVEPGVVV